MEFEEVVLENLIHNEGYSRKVLPFLKPEYFPDNASKAIFEQIHSFITKYNNLPTQSELIVELKNRKGLQQGDFEDAVDIVNALTKKTTAPALDWMLEHTEKFCRERALYNTLIDAAERLEDVKASGVIDFGMIPEALENALAITFDTTVGLDYDVVEDRWERRQQRQVEKVRFSVESFNEATNGGMNLKTLVCVAGGTGSGKSAWMCDQAAHSMMNGVDVLYISLELDEDSIADRIDANILGIDVDDVVRMPKADYTRLLKKKLDGKTCGKLVIKEYPTSCAGVLEFRALLNELKLKKNFIPKLIVVDYLNICSSSRYKAGAVNSYTLVKAIAEELRGLAKEFNAVILTGTQLNRDGVENENVSLREISESSGLSHTVDMLFAIMRTELLDKMNQVMVKQLKNRFADMTRKLRFIMGVDRAKFRYFSVEEDGEPVPNDSDEESEQKETWNGNFGVKKRQKNFGGINT